jgi:hypothetical protein
MRRPPPGCKPPPEFRWRDFPDRTTTEDAATGNCE